MLSEHFIRMLSVRLMDGKIWELEMSWIYVVNQRRFWQK